MSEAPRILLVGTADTKHAELQFLRQAVQAAGGQALVMDVGVLGTPPFAPEFDNLAVAAAAGTTPAALAALGDENAAMARMAEGAALLAARACAQGHIHGLLALGGTMGTDLALDVAAALPLGVPKLLLSTIAHSPLLPPQRIPADLIAMLWAGGLHGLNPLCRSALAQAAGAVVGACRAAGPPHMARPLVGMTSLGASVLRPMKRLAPALAERGYELAVFHTAGMGGRAFEDLAARGLFAAVFDFSLQELANELFGSCVSAGPDRLRGAGRAGVPQIVAPGAVDMIDFATGGALPEGVDAATVHAHNRLVSSALAGGEQRRRVARAISERLRDAGGPTCLLLPTGGVDEWDRPGGPMHAPAAHAAFVDEMRRAAAGLRVVEVDAHINDPAFCDAALAVFDAWCREGLIAAPAP